MKYMLEILQSFAVSGARLGLSTFAEGHADRPAKPLELYEFEACPYCRKVRDALSVLDLDAMIYPCPKGGTLFRKRVKELGGKAMFPFLIDPNTGAQMYESDDIIQYLFATYGSRKPGPLLKGSLATATSMLASAIRPLAGGRKRPSATPGEPLELYSFESSPFSRIVRETLCELEIPYLLHNVAKGTQKEWVPPLVRDKLGIVVEGGTENRRRFIARSGKMQVPYLIDPNTGVAMFESAAIRKYLLETYGR